MGEGRPSLPPPPPPPGLSIGLSLPWRRSWWGPQELPWILGARPGSSWAPPVALHPKGRPFEPLYVGGHGVARGGRGVPLSLASSLPPTPAHNTALTSRAAKATRNLGVVIQQAQTCFMPRGALPALAAPCRFRSFYIPNAALPETLLGILQSLESLPGFNESVPFTW